MSIGKLSPYLKLYRMWFWSDDRRWCLLGSEDVSGPRAYKAFALVDALAGAAMRGPRRHDYRSGEQRLSVLCGAGGGGSKHYLFGTPEITLIGIKSHYADAITRDCYGSLRETRALA
ncbi:hypothetical protein EVAR_92629_1 [Eumeta japonica]|uniref:Uncharacterized protein n=1 Tax=Eumeta variegata TaxID=151549 RepID=A0A4C1T090_EUMVA|nr:hypothetical protein EVAR_92629_1 [Eumeta japonica]